MTTKACALTLALCLAVAAVADDAARYRYFAEGGVLDAGVSNEAANALVREGIASGNPEIVELTVWAIIELTAYRLLNLRTFQGPPPERTFQEVAGLKGFLIEYRHERREAAERDSSAAIDAAEREAEVDGSPDCEIEDAECWENWIRTDILRSVPIWVGILRALCAYWPKDGDVHDLIWEEHETSAPGNSGSATLALLNFGAFTTPRAEEFRIAQLAAVLQRSDTEAAHEISEVARGLALSHPPAALAPLIEVARVNIFSRNDVLVAIAGYDDEQLAAHAAALRELVGGSRPWRPMGAHVEAYDRLKDISLRAP